MVAQQLMQADVVARRKLGGSVTGLSGDGVDKRSHVRAWVGNAAEAPGSVVNGKPDNPRGSKSGAVAEA